MYKEHESISDILRYQNGSTGTLMRKIKRILGLGVRLYQIFRIWVEGQLLGPYEKGVLNE